MKFIFKIYLCLFSLLLSLSALANDKCLSAFSEKEEMSPSHPAILKDYFDHTLLKPDASWEQIKNIVEEAVKYRLKAVCVNSCRVKEVSSYLEKIQKVNSSIYIPMVAATIGFPLGAASGTSKRHESEMAIQDGAHELDMVINIGLVKDGNWKALRNDIRSVTYWDGSFFPTKTIIETDLLTKEEIIEVSKIAVEEGALFVKTSTGFVPGGKGALLENIMLMQEGISQADHKSYSEIEIKASGGIKTLDQALEFIEAGVTRIGSSSSIGIMEEAINRHVSANPDSPYAKYLTQ